MVVFRFEVALFLGIVLLMELARGRLGVKKLLLHFIPAGAVWLGKLETLYIHWDSAVWRHQLEFFSTVGLCGIWYTHTCFIVWLN